MPMPATAYVLAFNEEPNSRDILPTVAWADEVLVVDSISRDGTVEIAREFVVELRGKLASLGQRTVARARPFRALLDSKTPA